MYIYEDMPTDTIQDFLDEFRDKIEKEKALKGQFEGEYPNGGYGVSTLRPRHVQDGTNFPDANNNNWRTTIGTALTWEDWINLSLERRTAVAVEGFVNRTPSPSLLEVRWVADGREAPAQNIEKMYTHLRTQAWLSAPFGVLPDKSLEIELYGRTAQVELCGLLGHTFAENPVLIDES